MYKLLQYDQTPPKSIPPHQFRYSSILLGPMLVNALTSLGSQNNKLES